MKRAGCSFHSHEPERRAGACCTPTSPTVHHRLSHPCRGCCHTPSHYTPQKRKESHPPPYPSRTGDPEGPCLPFWGATHGECLTRRGACVSRSSLSLSFYGLECAPYVLFFFKPNFVQKKAVSGFFVQAKSALFFFSPHRIKNNKQVRFFQFEMSWLGYFYSNWTVLRPQTTEF